MPSSPQGSRQVRSGHRRPVHRLPGRRRAGKGVHIVRLRGWGYGPGWYGGGWYGAGGGVTTGTTSTIYIGQLALDMYASAPHKLVWRGVVSKTLDTKAKPDKQEKNLKKAVAKMLKNYPPKQKK